MKWGILWIDENIQAGKTNRQKENKKNMLPIGEKFLEKHVRNNIYIYTHFLKGNP